MAYGRGRRARARWLVVALALTAGLRTPALGQAPQLPAIDPNRPSASTGSATEESVEDRLKKLEEQNKKLLDRLEKLSDENQKLTKEVQNLSSKVKEKDSGDSGEGDGAGQGENKESGLAGMGPPDSPELPAEAYTEGGMRSSGLRLLPNAQIKGNRRLGRIPLKGYFDYGKDGVGFATEDDEFILKFRAELQADSLDYLGATQALTHSGFYIPRTRFYFQGHYTKPITYQLSFQRSYTTFGFLNVFLNFNYDPRFQFRIGRFKVPFAYEWYKLNNWRLITPERSLFNENFGLNRMVGIQEWGSFLEDRIEYAVGMFDGPRNSIQDYNSAKDVVAFLNFQPFVRTDSFLKRLNFGGSYDYGIQDNIDQPAVMRTNVNASSTGLNDTDPVNNAAVPFLAFNANTRERGLRQLYDLHLAYYYGGLSVIGSFGGGVDSYAVNNRRPVPLQVDGYYIALAYLLTGETLAERTVVDPIHRFDLRPGKFGLGAFEPFFRFSNVSISNQVFTSGLADPNLWTNHVNMTDVGMNWYLNRAVKIYFDWQHAMYGQPVYFRPGGFRPTNDLLWLRFQFYF